MATSEHATTDKIRKRPFNVADLTRTCADLLGTTFTGPTHGDWIHYKQYPRSFDLGCAGTVCQSAGGDWQATPTDTRSDGTREPFTLDPPSQDRFETLAHQLDLASGLLKSDMSYTHPATGMSLEAGITTHITPENVMLQVHTYCATPDLIEAFFHGTVTWHPDGHVTVEYDNADIIPQGTGLGSAYAEWGINQYARWGVQEITAMTSEIGAYAWATAGFNFRNPRGVGQSLFDFLRRDGPKPSTVSPDCQIIDWTLNDPAGLEQLAARLCSRTNPPTAQQLANFGRDRPDRHGHHDGKKALLSGMRWLGTYRF